MLDVTYAGHIMVYLETPIEGCQLDRILDLRYCINININTEDNGIIALGAFEGVDSA